MRESMRRKTRIALAVGVITITLGAVGTVVVSAAGRWGPPITNRPRNALLLQRSPTGQGRVTGTGSSGTYYEVW
jgi:hypothetical protein